MEINDGGNRAKTVSVRIWADYSDPQTRATMLNKC